jgi:putative DNA methylase
LPTAARSCRQPKISAGKQGGKYYTRHSPSDQALLQQVEDLWVKNRGILSYPKGEIPSGEKTKSGLLAHHYRYWHQMFNARQLLALNTLLDSVTKVQEPRIREQFLLCVSGATDTNNVFSRYMASRDSAGGQTVQGVFARHDYQPKMTVCEQNVWGLAAGGTGSFIRRYWQSRAGIAFAKATTDVRYDYVDGKARSEHR